MRQWSAASVALSARVISDRVFRVNSKLLMRSSAVFLLLLGCITTFAPQELLARFGIVAQPIEILLVQADGALYLGFAVLNWMAKDNLIGGIYSRPVAVGNLLHFTVMTITLLKFIVAGQREPAVMLVCSAYLLFAIWFGLIAFGSPVGKKPV